MTTPLVALSNVAKSFGATQALRGFDLAVRRGTVHGLVGENGAGKSTLGKLIAGVHQPDEGTMSVHGRPVRYRSPLDALGDGISLIAQEQALLPRRTVLQNVFTGIEPGRAGVLDRRGMRRRFAELLDRTGFELDPDSTVGDLRAGTRTEVEILRAIARGSDLIVMDEPTAALSHHEATRLFRIVRGLVAAGTAVVYVSHRLTEVLDLADTITVLKDGTLVCTGPASGQTERGLVQAMLGRPLDALFPPKRGTSGQAAVLCATGLARKPDVVDVSLDLRPGEIVGLAGLVGAGRSEAARLLFGADRPTAGTIEIDGRRTRIGSPRAAMRHGIGMVPESRKLQGLVLARSVRDNITLGHTRELATAGVVRPLRLAQAAREMCEQLDVRLSSDTAPITTLSGGNQQKVLFGKWLMRTPRILIVDEPTHGVDVGAKAQIYTILDQLARDGCAILMISSDMAEIMGMADRIVVMAAGRVVAELRGDADEEDVLAAAFDLTGAS